jgi:molybdate transport system substrate-binding protein
VADCHLLSGGAAQGLVRQLQAQFEHSSGDRLQATFGAVGAMQKLLSQGAACDLLILTRSLIAQMVHDATVRPDSVVDLGIVKTGIAVKQGAQLPDVHDADSLRAALCAADAIYLPDPQLATAGIHFNKVLQELGIAETVAARLRPFPNGNAAMTAMAAASDANPIGCTQVTEILITPGVTLVTNLPAAFELATVYTAGVCSAAAHPASAHVLAQLLTDDAHADVRRQCGFLPLI